MGRVGRPYPDGLVLRGRGDVGFLQDGGRPGDVADPVVVAFEGECRGVFLVGGTVVNEQVSGSMVSETIDRVLFFRKEVSLVIPYLDRTIAPSRHEPPHSPRTRFTADQTPRHDRGRPAHGIHTGPVRLEYLMRPIAFLEFKDRYLAIGASAGEQTAGFVRGPGDDVDGGGV